MLETNFWYQMIVSRIIQITAFSLVHNTSLYHVLSITDLHQQNFHSLNFSAEEIHTGWLP